MSSEIGYAPNPPFASEERHPGLRWGQYLERARLQRCLSVEKAARACKCHEQLWHDWVAGRAFPVGRQRQDIYTTFRGMAAHEALMLTEFEQWASAKRARRSQPLTHSPFAEIGIEKASVIATVNEQDTGPDCTGLPFNEALTLLRKHNRLGTSDLAYLVDVGSGSVLRWEHADDVPIAAHYEKLLKVFPSLATANQPLSKAIPKPGPPLGSLSAPAPAKKEIAMPPQSPSAAETFKDGVKFATLLGTLATGREGNRVLEMLQTAKARGLTIDDVLSLMTEAGK